MSVFVCIETMYMSFNIKMKISKGRRTFRDIKPMPLAPFEIS